MGALLAAQRLAVGRARGAAARGRAGVVANRAPAHHAPGHRRGAHRGRHQPMMLTFVLLAAALTLAGVLVVVIPLLRGAAASEPPAHWAALGAAGVLVLGSAVLYIIWSNWPWRAAEPADSPQAMVARL